ncbi:MAG: hypothetical protein HY551_06825, partial [Elusimicrobia bacterium]|nr:hypothetical protein [Elusimicrobiota bacterium]
MPAYRKVKVPPNGSRIGWQGGKLQVPDNPVIPFIEGDGTGPDIWRASRIVLDAVVDKAYKGKRRIAWMEVHAGLCALQNYDKDTVLPQETLDAITEFRVAIKGPLTTPVGGFKYVCLVCAAEQNEAAGRRPEECVKCGSEWVAPRFRSVNVGLRQKLDLYACVRPVRWFSGVPCPVKQP